MNNKDLYNELKKAIEIPVFNNKNNSEHFKY